MKTGTKKLVALLGFVAVLCGVIIHLQPWEKGRIKLIGQGVSIELRDIWGRRASLTSNGEAVEAFAGTYRPKSIQITAKEKTGREFSIKTEGPWGELSKIKVRKNETTVIECGPPLKTEAKISRKGSIVSIEFSVIGKAREDYTCSVPDSGEMTILDEQENVLSMGRFGVG